VQQLASGGDNDSRNASSNRVTVTLIVILMAYLVCQLPVVTVLVLNVIYDSTADRSYAYYRFTFYRSIAGDIGFMLNCRQFIS
jgi:hypothetical protein